ncbi:MAG: nucleotidyltransferase domain-containing protein [Nanoarchaeota archaeon]|nr:nucleotidyltransferase domain-containing protein [Nanoarchaeota archaeon]MBU0978147.1 nucleotidyltransferase domain-containing protein [Nanoarchaeota archaeon]
MRSPENKKLGKVELLELNEAYQKVMRWFFSYPLTPISLTELAKEAEISKKTANEIVEQLVNDEFLGREIIGKSWRLTCHQRHLYNITRKIPYNLSLIYESDLINMIYKLIGHPRAIVLFGSYRKGDDTEKSDIDLAVEVIDNEELRIIKLGEFSEFGYRKNVPVNLYIFSKNKIDLNLFTNIANGIVIEGMLEVRP